MEERSYPVTTEVRTGSWKESTSFWPYLEGKLSAIWSLFTNRGDVYRVRVRRESKRVLKGWKEGVIVR